MGIIADKLAHRSPVEAIWSNGGFIREWGVGDRYIYRNGFRGLRSSGATDFIVEIRADAAEN